MTGLFLKLNFILRFCCINEKNIWKFCGFMTHRKCVKSMLGETWIELFCTHYLLWLCGTLREKCYVFSHATTLNPKICHKHSWKWFSFTYLKSGCVSQRSIINNLLWPFQKAISVFCFCVWIRPSHCGQTDKQYSWTVTRSAVAFERVKKI